LVELSGEQLIPLSQDAVWRGLNDPEVLKASIPGCDSIEKLSETDYKVVVTAAIGPVKAKFTGKLVLSNIDAPHSYSLNFDGSGGAAGFSKGSANVALTAEGRNTRLRYSTKASVGGQLAQVGSRLIDGVAAKLAEDFFTRFNQTLAPRAPEVAPAEEMAKPAGLNPLWIVAGIIAAMLVASWLIGAPRYVS
jgi:carbon monoxide dehydrogenase subunit G